GTLVPVSFDPLRDVFFIVFDDETGHFYRCILDPPFEACYLDTAFQPAAFKYVPPVILFPPTITVATVVQTAPIVSRPFLLVRGQKFEAIRPGVRPGVRAARVLAADPRQPRPTTTFRAAPPRIT